MASKGDRDREHHRYTADQAILNRFIVAGVPYRFEGEIDWTFNPTAGPGSPYSTNNQWTWQFNRHYFWISLAKAYEETGDAIYADAFVRQMLHWVKSNPVPEEWERRTGSPWRTIEAGIRARLWPRVYFSLLDSPSFTDEALLAMMESFQAMVHPETRAVLTGDPEGANIGIYPLRVDGLGAKVVKGLTCKDGSQK